MLVCGRSIALLHRPRRRRCAIRVYKPRRPATHSMSTYHTCSYTHISHMLIHVCVCECVCECITISKNSKQGRDFICVSAIIHADSVEMTGGKQVHSTTLMLTAMDAYQKPKQIWPVGPTFPLLECWMSKPPARGTDIMRPSAWP